MQTTARDLMQSHVVTLSPETPLSQSGPSTRGQSASASER